MEHRLRELLELRVLTGRGAARAFALTLALTLAACTQDEGDVDGGGPDVRQLDDAPIGGRDVRRSDDTTDVGDDAGEDPEDLGRAELSDDAEDTRQDVGGEDDGGEDPDAAASDAADDPDDPDTASDAADDATLDDPDTALDSAPDDADADATKPPPDLTYDEPDAADVSDAEPDTGPPPTPDPGVYVYDRLPVGGLSYVEAAAFHPDGSYFILLDHAGYVHVRDMASGTGIRFAPVAPAGDIAWQDVVFAPDGAYALLLGGHEDLGAAVYRFDDAVYRALGAEGDPLTTVSLLETYSSNDLATTAVYPPDGADPVVVAATELTGGFWTVVLWRLDPETGDSTLVSSQGGVQGPCLEAAYTSDLYGNPGLLLSCNLSVLFLYYEDGVATWNTGIRTADIGNMGGIAAHPRGEYALIVGWSGRRVHRFERGLLTPRLEAPSFCTREVHNVAFQPNGRRALISGGAMTVTSLGTFLPVIEYRHDLFDCEDASFCVTPSDCSLTEVPLLRFDQAPYGGDSSYFFPDIAWSPTCDGGVIVGGKLSFSGDVGMVITFDVAGGEACWD